MSRSLAECHGSVCHGSVCHNQAAAALSCHGHAGGPTETRPGRLLHWHSLEVVFHLEVTESRRRARRRLQPAPGPGTGNTLSARARQPGPGIGAEQLARVSGYQLEVQVKTRIWQLNLLRRCPVRAAVATVTTVEAKCRACGPRAVCRSAGCWRGGVPVGGNLLAESLPFLSAAPGPSAGAADWKEKNLQTNEVQPLKCSLGGGPTACRQCPTAPSHEGGCGAAAAEAGRAAAPPPRLHRRPTAGRLRPTVPSRAGGGETASAVVGPAPRAAAGAAAAGRAGASPPRLRPAVSLRQRCCADPERLHPIVPSRAGGGGASGGGRTR